MGVYLHLNVSGGAPQTSIVGQHKHDMVDHQLSRFVRRARRSRSLGRLSQPSASMVSRSCLSFQSDVHLFIRGVLASRPPRSSWACCAGDLCRGDVLGVVPGCRGHSRTGSRPRAFRKTAARSRLFYYISAASPLCAGICCCRDQRIQAMSERVPNNPMHTNHRLSASVGRVELTLYSICYQNHVPEAVGDWPRSATMH